MSILSELKKLTGKNSAKVVSEALPDSLTPSGGGGIFVVGEGNYGRLDKTFQEIEDAAKQNLLVVLVRWKDPNYTGSDGNYFSYLSRLSFEYAKSLYTVGFIGSGGGLDFICSNKTDYPA